MSWPKFDVGLWHLVTLNWWLHTPCWQWLTTDICMSTGIKPSKKNGTIVDGMCVFTSLHVSGWDLTIERVAGSQKPLPSRIVVHYSVSVPVMDD